MRDRDSQAMVRRVARIALIGLCMAAGASSAGAQGSAPTQPQMDIYGFVMLDTGIQFKQNHPDWFDTVRPTKLPSFEDEFGKDGHWFSGVRQSRFGVKSAVPTSDFGPLLTTFEFELFGTGVDAGQTTFRLRHAYGELGAFGAGQTWSPFMDPDVFPNTIEYWGPNGMVFFRNVQVRYTPIAGDMSLMFAIERPGASGDAGVLADRIELQNVKARFPLPDFSGAYKYSGSKGYLKGAFLLGQMKWDDTLDDGFDLSGSATRWGINLSSNVKFGKDTLRLQYAFGEGIQNYMNDAPVDIGIKANPGNAVTPIMGVALPVQGLVAFFDHTWNEEMTSSAGYSRLDIDNSEGQAPSAFKAGQYAVFNVLYTPVKDAMVGGEFQWGARENFSDGFTSNDYRLQVSFKYNFSYRFGG